MPYVSRAPVLATCVHFGTAYNSTHLRRKYCCNPCNVLAAQARKKARLVLTSPQALPISPVPEDFLLLARIRALAGSVHLVGVPATRAPRE